MKLRGPIVTLVAVAVMATVLLLINSYTVPPSGADPGAAATAGGSPTPAATATPFPAKARYVGTATKKDGSTVPIAITVDGSKVKAYLCDGKAIEAWFQGSQSAGMLSDVKGRGNNKLEGHTITGNTVKGQVTVRVAGKDELWPVQATEVAQPAGLYRARTAQRTTGWIVQAGGGQVGITSGPDSAPTPAPALDPNNPGDAKSVDGGDEVVGR